MVLRGLLKGQRSGENLQTRKLDQAIMGKEAEDSRIWAVLIRACPLGDRSNQLSIACLLTFIPTPSKLFFGGRKLSKTSNFQAFFPILIELSLKQIQVLTVCCELAKLGGPENNHPTPEKHLMTDSICLDNWRKLQSQISPEDDPETPEFSDLNC